jgi:hypothetical protein
MSDYNIIADVSLALKGKLVIALQQAAAQYLVELKPPGNKPEKELISLWLYKVTRNSDVSNNDRERSPAGDLIHRPLPLDLHYLITPELSTPQAEQVVLGSIMQNFHSWPTLSLLPGNQTTEVSLKITPELLSVEQHSQLWQALSQPFRLSVSYLVQCVRIDSLLPPTKAPPIQKSEIRFSQIVASSSN